MFSRPRKTASGILIAYQRLSAVLAGSALALICISLACQIAARLASLKGSGWTIDLTQSAMIWMTGAGGGLLASRRLLLKLDLLTPGKIRKILTTAITLAAGLAIAVAGSRAALNNWGQTSPVLNIPMGMNYLALVWAGLGIIFSAMPPGQSRSGPAEEK
jgi:TRAP-type C4-dicarboxylate transport system permease small subunit